MTCAKGCYGCMKPMYGDRVRDSSGRSGYGRIWSLEGDYAFVQFGSRGPLRVAVSELEFVSRDENMLTPGGHTKRCAAAYALTKNLVEDEFNFELFNDAAEARETCPACKPKN